MSIRLLLGSITLLAIAPTAVLPQAWVPAQRGLTVYTGYQYLDAEKHLFSVDIPPEAGGDGSNRLDLGQISAQTVLFGVDYGITSRLAASASVAYVASRYQGQVPDNLEIDDGTWNDGFQDASIGLRYMVLRAPIVLTPTIQAGFPTHSYETLGHAALGRDLNEIRLGVNMGWVGRSVLSGVYLHGGYSYAYVEKADGMRPNRSDVTLEAGYFLTQKLVLRANGTYAHTHEGLDWIDDLAHDEGPGDAHFDAHDRLAKTVATTVGGGLSYAFGGANVSLGVLTTLSGENTHDSTVAMFSVSRNLELR